MKLLFITGSRGEWGYIRPILEICKKKKIKYYLFATNMHLLDSYGFSLKEIIKDGFRVDEKIFSSLDGYNNLIWYIRPSIYKYNNCNHPPFLPLSVLLL